MVFPFLGFPHKSGIVSLSYLFPSEVVRVVIVRTCKELKRDNGMIIRYDDNAGQVTIIIEWVIIVSVESLCLSFLSVYKLV